MLEKEQLRKADIFTGLLFFIFGLFILSQAFQMPMKDSWGGVQNVWYVSPALFPLFIGSVITLLGAILTGKGVKAVGSAELQKMFSSFSMGGMLSFLTKDSSLRFIAIATLFVFYVYMSVPRIDFVLCSIQFLIGFITMFFFDDTVLLKKLFALYTTLSLIMLLFLVTGLEPAVSKIVPYSADILTIVLSAVYAFKAWQFSRVSPELADKFKTSMIVALVTPFVLGGVFKYFLLVPLIHEGLVINIADAIRYM